MARKKKQNSDDSSAKTFAQLFLIYFACLGLLILGTWVKYLVNTNDEGGEMADSFFLIGLVFATIYFAGFARFTYSAYLKADEDAASAGIALGIVFVFAVAPSALGLLALII